MYICYAVCLFAHVPSPPVRISLRSSARIFLFRSASYSIIPLPPPPSFLIKCLCCTKYSWLHILTKSLYVFMLVVAYFLCSFSVPVSVLIPPPSFVGIGDLLQFFLVNAKKRSKLLPYSTVISRGNIAPFHALLLNAGGDNKSVAAAAVIFCRTCAELPSSPMGVKCSRCCYSPQKNSRLFPFRYVQYVCLRWTMDF